MLSLIFSTTLYDTNQEAEAPQEASDEPSLFNWQVAVVQYWEPAQNQTL